MNEFMQGATVMACVVIGLFFLRFWRRSRDRLFLFFSVAFLMLGANWMSLALTPRDETDPFLYLVRLFAFVVILVGIYDKNRSSRHARADSSEHR